MSKHHRNRNWAPAPQPLPEDAHVIDDHTHVASVVPFSQAMSHEAVEKGQGDPLILYRKSEAEAEGAN